MSGDRQPRVHAYARASTKKQEASPEVQCDAIRKYCALYGLPEPASYVDPGKSGKIAWEERDAGRELFGRLRPGDHVIIHKLDRAFRRLADCVVVLERFERMGIKLHIVNLLGGAIDLTSPMGKFLIHILAAFAELERAFVSERTKEGLNKRKQSGAAYTRFPGYGFKWEVRKIDGRRVKVKVPDPEERAIMRQIHKWRMQNVDWDTIRQALEYDHQIKQRNGQPWSVMRIRRACKAEATLRVLEQQQKEATA